MNININIDDELKLLRGSSFFMDGIEIKPFTIAEITDQIGYEKYQQLLNIFILEVKDILKEVPEELNNINVFDLIVQGRIRELFEGLLESICLFLRINNLDELDINENGLVINTKLINSNNWDKLCKIIKMQNCISKQEEEKYNPANEKAREIIEKIKRYKNEMPKKKELITFPSMISGLAWKSNNVNIFDVYNLTIYQLYDGLKRLNLIDDYQFTLSGIYAGTVDSKKINLNNINWMKTIEN
jgi:hypothetical protein